MKDISGKRKNKCKGPEAGRCKGQKGQPPGDNREQVSPLSILVQYSKSIPASFASLYWDASSGMEAASSPGWKSQMEE